jgi:hypothetical protein
VPAIAPTTVPRWASASLRIATENLTVEEVSEALKLKPTQTRNAEGEPSFAVWIYEAPLDSAASVEDHLYLLVERLRDRLTALREIVALANVEIWLSAFAGSQSVSAVLNSQVLAELGALGIDVVLDLHGTKPSADPAIVSG